MNNEERKEKQKAIMNEYKRKIEAEPEVKKWINHKKIIRSIGIVYLLAYFGIEYIAYISVDADINLVRLGVKALFAIAWFALFIMPTGAWKLGLMFFVSAIYNTMGIIKAFENLNGFDMYFENGPLWSIYFIMSILVPILFFALGCWLTIPKKHKDLSDRAMELNKEYVEELKQMSIENV